MSVVVASEKMIEFLSALKRPVNADQLDQYERLCEMQFPTSKTEYWRYTRLNKIVKNRFVSPSSHLSKSEIESLVPSENVIVLENGLLRDDCSSYLTSGVLVRAVKSGSENAIAHFGQQLDLNHVFSALNSTFYSEVLFIHVPENMVMDETIHIVLLSHGENVLSNPRIFVQVDKGASAKLSISFSGYKNSTTLCNAVIEANVGENGQLCIDKLQSEVLNHFCIVTEQISQQRNSQFKINTAILGDVWVRNNLNIAVVGENCETHMNGIVMVGKNAHADNHTFVDHQVPNCFSNEHYRYVLEDKATGVFNGKVVVRQHAQKINAYQKNANILLSDQALMNSKPELEIYADDVKCSHGSTTGQLDEDAVFYLQTRGLSRDKARKLLISAFVREITEHFASAFLVQELESKLIQDLNN